MPSYGTIYVCIIILIWKDAWVMSCSGHRKFKLPIPIAIRFPGFTFVGTASSVVAVLAILMEAAGSPSAVSQLEYHLVPYEQSWERELEQSDDICTSPVQILSFSYKHDD